MYLSLLGLGYSAIMMDLMLFLPFVGRFKSNDYRN